MTTWDEPIPFPEQRDDDAAPHIVEALPRHSGGDFLFSSRGGKVPIAGFSKAKKLLDKLALEVLRRDDPDATLTKYTFHDFRSSHKTRLAALGIIQEHRNAVHGHVQKGMDAIYNKHDYAEAKRAALRAYAEHLMEVIS